MKLSRRAFLVAASSTALAAVLPAPVAAAPSTVIILEAVKDIRGVYSTVRLPANLAAQMGEARAGIIEAASNRALAQAQAQNLARPAANGLLTRIWRPALKASPRGIAHTLLQAGLVLGFAWALSNAQGELGKDTSSMTMNAKECAALPVNTSDMWQRSSGVYRTSASSSTAIAVQRTVGTSRGGTVASPNGWQWAGQRAVSTEAGTTTWDVQFTKNVACGERVAFPPGPVEGAVPGAEHGGNEADANSEANKTKIIDGLHRQAENDFKAGIPLPGGETTTTKDVDQKTLEDTKTKAPITDATKPIKPVDLTTPWTQIGDDQTQVEFPPEVELGTQQPGTNPTPTPTPTPGATPTPGGIDWGTPPEGDIPGAPTPFAWVPTPWVAPDLPGQCAGVPYNFSVVFRGASGSINPCPALSQARPIIRPVAVLGWTVYAIAQFLDL